MNARQLEVFRAIMHHGTLTRAAEELNVSQSALSQVLLRIEDQIGQLFVREKGRLRPTPLAKQLLPEVDRVFAEIDKLRSLTKEIKSGRWAPVRIAASTPLLMSTIPPLLQTVKERKWDIPVFSSVLPVPGVMEAVESGRADLGLTLIPSTSTKLKTEVIGETEFVCLLPEGHRLAEKSVVDIHDLQDESLISYSQNNEFGSILANLFAATGIPYQPDIAVDVSITTVIFVQSALGIAVVEGNTPWSAFAGVVQRTFRPRVTLPICIVKDAHRPPTRSQTVIEQSLRTIIEEST